MSFILTFFHEPAVTTVDEAAAWLSKTPETLPQASPRFANFIAHVTQFYPDLSDEEDCEDRNLWPEGLGEVDGRDAYLNLLINPDMLDPGVMTVIAQCAATAGLSILDEQNGLLYLSNFRMIGLDDAAPAALPPISAVARELMTENLHGMGLQDAQRQMADALCQALGAGFGRTESRIHSIVWRHHGDLRQMLSLGVMRSTDNVSARLYVTLGFASEQLSDRFMPLLPESFEARRRKYDRAEGGAAPQVWWYVPDLARGDPHKDLLLYSHSLMRFTNPAELATLIAGACAWVAEVLKPYIDAIRTVEDLRVLTINPARLKHCGVRRLSFPEYPSILTLARLSGVETFEAYVAAYREGRKLAELSAFFKEPDNQHFEQLVEGLRALD